MDTKHKTLKLLGTQGLHSTHHHLRTEGLRGTNIYTALPACPARSSVPEPHLLLPTALVGLTLLLWKKFHCLKVTQVENGGLGAKAPHAQSLAHLSASHTPQRQPFTSSSTPEKSSPLALVPRLPLSSSKSGSFPRLRSRPETDSSDTDTGNRCL